jgi:hypothetical protein
MYNPRIDLPIWLQQNRQTETLLIPNGTRFARCDFRTQKSLDFQGLPPPIALEMDFPTSKALRPPPYKQQEH